MHHAIVLMALNLVHKRLIYFMSQFPEIYITKCNQRGTHRKVITLSRLRWTKYVKSLVKIHQITSINAKLA